MWRRIRRRGEEEGRPGCKHVGFSGPMDRYISITSREVVSFMIYYRYTYVDVYSIL